MTHYWPGLWHIHQAHGQESCFSRSGGCWGGLLRSPELPAPKHKGKEEDGLSLRKTQGLPARQAHVRRQEVSPTEGTSPTAGIAQVQGLTAALPIGLQGRETEERECLMQPMPESPIRHPIRSPRVQGELWVLGQETPQCYTASPSPLGLWLRGCRAPFCSRDTVHGKSFPRGRFLIPSTGSPARSSGSVEPWAQLPAEHSLKAAGLPGAAVFPGGLGLPHGSGCSWPRGCPCVLWDAVPRKQKGLAAPSTRDCATEE